jgi:hypothetical protein
MYYSTCDVTQSLLVLLLAALLFLWNLVTQVKSTYSYYSHFQLTSARELPLLSPTNLLPGPTVNTSRGLYPLFCDVTAYAEVCLPYGNLETSCITPLFHRCLARTTQKIQPHLLLLVGPCLQSCCLATR